jgi:hypothetical protein
MNLHSSVRKLVVLGLVIAAVAGFTSVATATIEIDSGEIVLVGDEEPTGALGNGMVSIGDTIEVKVVLDPVTYDPDSVLYVIADMRKYGGSESETLHVFQGQDAYASGVAWVPTCSGEPSANLDSLTIYHPDTTLINTEHWEICLYPSVDASATAPSINNICSGFGGNMTTPAIIDTAAVLNESWRVEWEDSAGPGNADRFRMHGTVTG